MCFSAWFSEPQQRLGTRDRCRGGTASGLSLCDKCMAAYYTMYSYAIYENESCPSSHSTVPSADWSFPNEWLAEWALTSLLRVHVSGILFAAGSAVHLMRISDLCYAVFRRKLLTMLNTCFIFLPLVSVQSPIFGNTLLVNPCPGEGEGHILPSPHVFRGYQIN